MIAEKLLIRLFFCWSGLCWLVSHSRSVVSIVSLSLQRHTPPRALEIAQKIYIALETMKVVQVRFPTIVFVVAIAFCLSLSGEAFAPPSPSSSSSSSTLKIASLSRRYHHHESQPQPLENDLPEQPSNKNKNHLATTTAIWTTVATTLWTTAPGMAWANDSPDWGLFEGRTGSLIHPVVMGGLFLYSAYTAFLGFQWRRQRTMGDEITQVKADLAAVTPAAAAAEGEAPPVKTAAQVELETSLETLQQERKDLAAAKPRDKHFSQGSFLAFLGTAIAIEVRLCVAGS